MNSTSPAKSKTIRIFLAEGSPQGILTAEIINWTGKIIVAPRTRLKALLGRDELNRTGIYFLIGPDPANMLGKPMIYVGEGDNVRKRRERHNLDEAKQFFSTVCVIVGMDDNLTKAHVRNLESRLITTIKKADKATLLNKGDPEFDLLPESDRADMDFYVEQIAVVLPVLGFDFLQPFALPVTNAEDHSPEFVLETVGMKARAREIEGQFIVLKGSTARLQGTPSWTAYKQLRERLITEGTLVPSDEAGTLKFAEDTSFNSPTAAAAVIIAANVNGRGAWCVAGSDQTYGDWERK